MILAGLYQFHRKARLVALTDLIKHDLDRIMIVDLGPADGGATERIEFLGLRAEDSRRLAVII